MGLKRNFIYSSILTVSNYFFPLITYPYVSRVLGVNNIGICNFVDSIINYFILFSMMGITTLGIREIAANKSNSYKQSRAFTNLFILNGISTLLMLVVLIVSMYTVPMLYKYRELLYIGAMKLVANLFLIEWFFKGIENFKYITKRTLIVKTLYVLFVFLLVKEQSDYNIYFLLLTLMTVVNAVINFVYACKFVKIKIKDVSLKKYITPFIVLGCYLLLTSMYTTFNVTYLGIIGGDTQVGYYTTATKIFTIILAFYTAFTGVMMPRMSSLFSEGKIEEFKQLVYRSINFLCVFAIPIVTFTTIYAPEIVRIISGDGYEGAYLSARIVMPLMLIIGLEQIFVIQILMPSKQDKVILRNSVIGAVVGVILNIILVGKLLSTGSALVWFISELCVLVCSVYSVQNKLQIYFPIKNIIKQILYYIPAVIILAIMDDKISCNVITNVILGISFIFVYTMFILFYVNKDVYIINVLSDLYKKVHRICK